MRDIDQSGIQFTEGCEGSREKTYLDQGGRLTGGTGHLLTAAEAALYPLGTVVPQEVRDQWLHDDSQDAERKLAARVDEGTLLRLTQHQYDALVDFVFNVGAGASWTIWKLLNAQKFDQVPAQFLRFDIVTDAKTGKHIVSNGLKNRRLAEIKLWNDPDVVSACAIAASCPVEQPSSYTRDVALTPPQPMALPAHFVASGLAKGGTVVSSVGAGAAAVQEQIAPHADVHPIFHQALVICTGVGIVCGVLGLAIHGLQAKDAKQ